MDYGGPPGNLYKIDKLIFLDDRKRLLQSALIAAISQQNNQKFEIFGSSDTGFNVNSGRKIGRLHYNNHEIIDDTLYQFENEIEHNAFLRKHKIKQIKKIL